MKNTALTLTLAGAVLAGGLASAQSSIFERRAIFEVPNFTGEVAFYSGDPKDGGVMVAEERINNSPVGQIIDGINNADHLTLTVDEQTYTVKTFPGSMGKFSIYLDTNGGVRENAMTLAELFDDAATNPSAVAQLEEPGSVQAELLAAR